ncbi:MAG TPA: fused MFS/spermidine synthase [Vicinamibacteria bacterium]|nr:fused MFS/spermidine synthase [Vicinamibacteria bacterium]
MPRRLPATACLVAGSGASALAYQLVWTRELRLVFGHSTAASAAVLALFIGGLGAGSLLIGPRADRHPRPLALYARLEAMIAIAAALSPLLLALARAAYISLGGSLALGSALATPVRLLLSALVLLGPTLLMGGTLPAAAREVEAKADARRRATALLYAANTLGAVIGALGATFFALERLGNRGTLYSSCGLNLAVALAAGLLARTRSTGPASTPSSPVLPAEAGGGPGPAAACRFVLAACGLVGFAFFLLELVWYRMLAPLLGGTVFTFGLILATALAGIALGGLAYALLGSERPATLRALSVTCLLEAAAVAAGFALGDRLALLAILLHPLGNMAFAGHVLGWSAVTALVVLPPALVAGYQYPLLIALLGRGRENVGRDVGRATVANTAGAVVGALAGGFGLLPLITAPGCWRAVAGLLLGLGLLAAALERRRGLLLLPAVLALAVLALLVAPGPTSAFRHSGIGAGRVDPRDLAGPNETEDWLRSERRSVIWEAEGRETSVALFGSTGLAFAVNGKVDGHSRYDAGTQVMAGLLGALLHPQPRRALVVGLGTGSTAGWLADVPGIERVDVVELEPAVAEVARRCAPVNRGALANPRLRLFFGDAREHLLTTRERYDLVVSEPSNPYRAGIASLFSREFYHAVASRLEEGGLFLQWVQSYEVEPGSIRGVYATLAAELPSVETCQTLPGDLMLVSGRTSPPHDLTRLAGRSREEPFRSALRDAWRTDSLEGLFAHFVASPAFAGRLRSAADSIDTDDRNQLEFGFARSLGRSGLLDVEAVRKAAADAGADHPAFEGGTLDLVRLLAERLGVYSAAGEAPPRPAGAAAGLARRADAHILWTRRSRPAALQAWRAADEEPSGPNETALVAEVMADAGEQRALAYVEALRAYQPAEADACLARLRLRQGGHEAALAALEAAFAAYRRDPWPSPLVMQGALDAALELAAQKPELGPRVLDSLRPEFALRLLNEVRVEEAFLVGSVGEPGPDCRRLLDPVEPHVPFTEPWLGYRVRCYARTGDRRLAAAHDDLRRFEARGRQPLLPEK